MGIKLSKVCKKIRKKSSKNGGAAQPPSNSKASVKNSSTKIKTEEEVQKISVPVPLVKLPHNYENIIKDADTPIDRSSNSKLYDQLCSGVFLNQHTKKYWVEKDSGGNSFMLFARSMSITWIEDPSYWKWTPVKETSAVMVDGAELVQVCWLEVTAKFDIRKLTPGITYEFAFVIMVKKESYGWEVPVSLELKIENEIYQEHKENLMTKPRDRWMEIPVGEFIAAPETQGQGQDQLVISLTECKGGTWKRGLVIKGILIQPKI